MINGSKADSSDRALRNIACINNNNGYGKHYTVECGQALSSDPDYNKKNGIWGLCEEEIESARLLAGTESKLQFDKSAHVNPIASGLLTNVRIEPVSSPGYVYVNGQWVACNSHQEWVDFAKEARMFCPGILVSKDSNGNYPGPLKQLKKCPPYKWPNEKLDDCECIYEHVNNDDECKPKVLSHADIYYGPLGKEGTKGALHKQCWTKRTKSAYRKCMGFDN